MEYWRKNLSYKTKVFFFLKSPRLPLALPRWGNVEELWDAGEVRNPWWEGACSYAHQYTGSERWSFFFPFSPPMSQKRDITCFFSNKVLGYNATLYAWMWPPWMRFGWPLIAWNEKGQLCISCCKDMTACIPAYALLRKVVKDLTADPPINSIVAWWPLVQMETCLLVTWLNKRKMTEQNPGRWLIMNHIWCESALEKTSAAAGVAMSWVAASTWGVVVSMMSWLDHEFRGSTRRSEEMNDASRGEWHWQTKKTVWGLMVRKLAQSTWVPFGIDGVNQA